MYGLDVLQYLKNDEKLKKISVILQIGTLDRTEINKALGLGAISCINKPYQASKVLEIIGKAT